MSWTCNTDGENKKHRPLEKKSLRGPSQKWEDNMKINLKETDSNDKNWIALAQDWIQWYSFVLAVLQYTWLEKCNQTVIPRVKYTKKINVFICTQTEYCYPEGSNKTVSALYHLDNTNMDVQVCLVADGCSDQNGNTTVTSTNKWVSTEEPECYRSTADFFLCLNICIHPMTEVLVKYKKFWNPNLILYNLQTTLTFLVNTE